MSALVLFILAVFVTTLRLERRTKSIRLEMDGTCYECRYDLSGLPVDARCPECGAEQRDRYNTVVWHDIVLHRPSRWALGMVPLLIAYLVLMYPLSEWMAITSYEVSGYPRDVAERAARARELRHGEFSVILWPLWMVVGASPLLTWLKRPRDAVKLLAAAIVVSIAYIIWAWIIRYAQ